MRKCACCSNASMEVTWNLPRLPLTGIFVDPHSQIDFQYFHDQELQFCTFCSHLQLSKVVDPELLYLETYTHRTSTSPISKSGNEFLLKTILEKQFKDKEQILEIGCNDIYLLKSLRTVSKNRAGIDPIFDDKKIEIEPGIFVHGGFAENIEYTNLIEKPVDLVISAHTFEHIVDPIKSLRNLKPYLAEKVDFIIEVPSSIRMIEQVRLDQVFSQHINYYSPKSISKLMEILNLEFVDIKYNYSYWGGTQILHFSNYNSTSVNELPALSKEILSNSIDNFLREIEVVKFKIKNSPGRVFAYGAAQMLPILKYHLGETFDLIDEILDDNPERVGKIYPFSDNQIIKPFEIYEHKQGDTLVITALDSAKILTSKLLSKGVNLIIVPIGNL